jgi:hypothetical protein
MVHFTPSRELAIGEAKGNREADLQSSARVVEQVQQRMDMFTAVLAEPEATVDS